MRPGLILGAAILIALTAAAIFAPWIASDPELMDLTAIYAPPSAEHWLGTDELGRDLLSRLLHGGRASLSVALAAALPATVLGAAIGLCAGYFGGRLDSVLMRLTDAVLALPLLPLLIVLAALDPGKLGVNPEWLNSEAFMIGRIALIVALVGWPGAARLVRGETMSVKNRDYVRAASALGAGPARIMLRHILPNVASPAITAAALMAGNVILVESALSFLGLGIQPPAAGWGNMLTGAAAALWTAPLTALWPGLAIFLAVLSFNLLGDGMLARLRRR